ncbi:HlyD family secretion protein [Carboxylicivirga caseinilyticus]|uniref:HlyD family secretion protein n=1 Tax=Carboxylicivirga caseinilyticus TaxID=3417572 RepID=UPI003D356E6F|nr:HlyD family efflux transporter periplasmic adaptor subunit [Marinilabiliaceae bacterium A049]
MLNISQNIEVGSKIDKSKLKSFSLVRNYVAGKLFTRLLYLSFFALVASMFLPWTQNIRSTGYVTALKPNQRPQTIHSVIGGRIENWFIQEGDFVKKGDTILFLSETKAEYMDPKLLQRTQQQIEAKELAVHSYMEKIKALDEQIRALSQTQSLKMEQTQNYVKQAMLKIQSDSIEYEASKTNYEIAKRQHERTQKLYSDGLNSLTELESRKLKMQETQAKMVSAENKLLTSRNNLINYKVELSSIRNQYREKLSKSESDKYSAMSALYDAEATLSKMQNQYMNYSVRTGMYYVTAPQDGYITKTIRTGIGETVKEGDPLVSIMPADFELAVEMYVDPIDLPLLHVGDKVRFMFDGWPSIVFSGWPNVSFGTFGGRVFAIDNFISENGQYRILVEQDKEEQAWPEQLRIGAGADGIALLNDVPVWYEIWRQMNGFPPDYYKGEKVNESTNKKK